MTTRIGWLAFGFGWLTVTAGVQAQGVAFLPTPAPAFSGVTLNATPVVSADRRYVRLTVNPYFNAIDGFSSFPVPAVVGGNGGGAGGLGGFRSMGVGGSTVSAGMNGVTTSGDAYAAAQSGYSYSYSASADATALLSGQVHAPIMAPAVPQVDEAPAPRKPVSRRKAIIKSRR